MSGLIAQLIGFWQYMFVPAGAPWYTGAVWSNQVQWTIVTLPVFLLAWWRMEVKHRKRHQELKAHIAEVINNHDKEKS